LYLIPAYLILAYLILAYLILAYLLLEAAKPPIPAANGGGSERDSSGTTEATEGLPEGAKVMERIARREGTKCPKRLAQIKKIRKRY
jgi:hypothetical protein